MKRLLLILLCPLILSGCKDDTANEEPVKDEFLEGEMIPGTEIFYPLNFFGDERMEPKVSPDGKLLVFRSLSVHPQEGIYLLDLSTAEQQLLVGGFVFGPAWSPDGQWISYNRGPLLYKMSLNDKTVVQLTERGRSFDSAWSPDGSRIAYSRSVSDADGPGGAWLMQADGTGKQSVADLVNAIQPFWHPINEKLISSTYTDTGLYNFTVYNLESQSVEHTVQPTEGKHHSRPQYSPDGSQILFTNELGIWIMGADGRNAKRILPRYSKSKIVAGRIGLFATYPSWHPDGKHIVYQHFAVTIKEEVEPGENHVQLGTEGYISLYKVPVLDAIAASNL